MREKRGVLIFWRIVGSIFAGVWIVNAFQMLGCEGIAFSGGGRVVGWTCIDPDPGLAGTVPGALAGLFIILVGFALIYWWWSPSFRIRPEPQTNAPVNRVSKWSAAGIDHLTDAATLDKLASDDLASIRLRVASNPHTPPTSLESLSRDELFDVRKAAIGNPSTPTTVIQMSANNDRATALRELALSVLTGRAWVDPESGEAENSVPTSVVEPHVLSASELSGRVAVLEDLASDPSVPSVVYTGRVHEALAEINRLHNDDVLGTADFKSLNSRLLAVLNM